MDASGLFIIGSFASASAVVVVTCLFLSHLIQTQAAQRVHDDRLFRQLEDLAHDKGQVIRENTRALASLERAITLLTQYRDEVSDSGPKRAEADHQSPRDAMPPSIPWLNDSTHGGEYGELCRPDIPEAVAAVATLSRSRAPI